MSNFPDDHEEEGVAYATVISSNYGYGKLTLYIRLPELKRSYPMDAVELIHSAQFGRGSSGDAIRMGEEPSYGWHFFATSHSDGLDLINLERTSKAHRKLTKRLDALTKASGTTLLLEDHLARLVSVSGVKYVYLPHKVDQKGSIVDQDLFCPRRDGISSIQGRLRFLKLELVKVHP